MSISVLFSGEIGILRSDGCFLLQVGHDTVESISTSALSPHNATVASKGKKSGKSIEETYQKLSQLDHVLLRPDTYIGSTEKQQQQLWVHDGERMVLKNVTVAPGLYKIFDEILVNAADNKVRDPTMNTLKVEIDEVCCAYSLTSALYVDIYLCGWLCIGVDGD